MPETHEQPTTRRWTSDAGSTTLAVALLTPAFVALAFAAWQAALWSHARTEARVVARDTAALIARSELSAAEAAGSARTVLAADTSMTNLDVIVGGGPGVIVVTITADAPGIIRGTSRPVSVTVAIPMEEVTPP